MKSSQVGSSLYPMIYDLFKNKASTVPKNVEIQRHSDILDNVRLRDTWRTTISDNYFTGSWPQ